MLACCVSSATVHRYVDAQAASIDGAWVLTDNAISYNPVLKGDPDDVWISPSQSYNSTGNSIGIRFYPTDGSAGSTDKLTYPLVIGNASFAPPTNGTVGYYNGFAVKFLSATDFQTPAGKVLCFQWWQGSPYGPPLRMAITGTSGSNVIYRFLVLNNDTLGNPSAVPLDIGGGTVPYGAWGAFVVYTKFNYAGGGVVTVWQNGTQVFTWTGKLGYDPSTKPYANATSATPYPNQKIQIEFGLYREAQMKKHMIFLDEIRHADTYAEALP